MSFMSLLLFQKLFSLQMVFLFNVMGLLFFVIFKYFFIFLSFKFQHSKYQDTLQQKKLFGGPQILFNSKRDLRLKKSWRILSYRMKDLFNK